MRRVLSIALVVLGLPSSTAAQAAAPDSVQRILRAEAASGFTGVAVLATADSIVWLASYGPPPAAARPGRPFWIASITKSFTAAAVLLLAQRGAVSLDDSLPRYFPRVPEDKQRITVRQLLTHTAGIGTTYTGGGLLDRDRVVQAILAQPLARLPGTGYQYEDDSYELLAALVELRTGEAWTEFVRREFLVPLGLLHTGFWCQSQPAAPAAPPTPGSCTSDWGHRGANGMFSTASDLLIWIRALAHPPARWAAVFGPITHPTVAVRQEGPFEVWSGLGSRVYTRDGQVTEIWLSGSGDDGHSCVARALTSGHFLLVLSDAGYHDGVTWSALVAQALMPRE